MMQAGRSAAEAAKYLRFLVVTAVASALTACAQNPAPAPVGNTASSTAPGTASVTGASFDGLYRGQVVITQNLGGLCNYGQPILGVKDGKVSRMWNGTRVYAPIGADGSFSGQGGRAFLQGTIKDGRIDAEMFDEYCRFKFDLTKT